ncbi:MAG: hypothetical protein J0J15_18285, partial [Mesorhizobium sp.]|nr:hypothetical protein [Mesorhizobium sp.]
MENSFSFGVRPGVPRIVLDRSDLIERRHKKRLSRREAMDGPPGSAQGCGPGGTKERSHSMTIALTHLQRLEAESIHIFREVAASFSK